MDKSPALLRKQKLAEQSQATRLVSHGFIQDFRLVLKASIPGMWSMLSFLLVQLVNTYFIGNINDSYLLAGVGMGNMLINVLCFATQQGMNGALESLVSQAYGFNNFRNCGVYLNRGRQIITFMIIPIAIIFVFSDKILVAIKQDP